MLGMCCIPTQSSMVLMKRISNYITPKLINVSKKTITFITIQRTLLTLKNIISEVARRQSTESAPVQAEMNALTKLKCMSDYQLLVFFYASIFVRVSNSIVGPQMSSAMIRLFFRKSARKRDIRITYDSIHY